jgi:S-methylmethionine-dependent homocysteine/selenocysteine methylase
VARQPRLGAKLGYDSKSLASANRRAIELLGDIRREYEGERSPMVISGCVGPRGDGYNPSNMMTAEEAERYRLDQIATFADTEADMVAAITMNYIEEAEGVVRAAKKAGMPVAVSFTVETDGMLPTGQSLESAITYLDSATNSYPAYYMINCAPPTHFETTLSGDGLWLNRIRGLRANASRKSHAELDRGDPAELGSQYGHVMQRLKHLNVLGGCCGTDHPHIQEIARACIRP